MTLHSFRLFVPFVQLFWVVKNGTYLAQRWEQTPIDLYHLADKERGFFVEVNFAQEPPLVLRSFVSPLLLEDYAHYVRLPKEFI